MNARTTALSALIAMRRQNAWADGALKDYTARDRLDRRDAAASARKIRMLASRSKSVLF